MTLREAISKKDRSPLLSTFMTKVDNFQYTTLVDDSNELKDMIDYQSPSVKRRALTISTAYSIAMRLLIALMASDTPWETFVSGSMLERNVSKLQEGKRILDDSSFDDLGNLYENTLKGIRELHKIKRSNISAEILAKISSYSVSLAWFLDWLSSGYFPRDVNIMRTNSETHIALTNEIMALLNSSYSNFLSKILKPGEMHEVILYPFIEEKEVDVIYYPDCIIDNVMYDFRTTFDMASKVEGYIKNLIACYLIQTDTAYDISRDYKLDSYKLYFPRFNVTFTLVPVNSDEFVEVA